MSAVDNYRSERGVLVMASLGTMLAPLNSTMIVVALPQVLNEFDRSLAWGSWIVISYLVAMAAFQPLGGSLGDRYGQRRIFLIGLMGFLMATTLAALAWNIEVLIVARTIQAISGATLIPNGTALVRTHVPLERQGRAFGRIGAGIAVAAALGPPLGGILTDSLNWRWIFVTNIFLIVPALVIAMRIPAARVTERLGRFDFRGAVLLTVALVALAGSLTVWRPDSVPLLVAPALGILALASARALHRHVNRTVHPVLDLGLFRRPGFLMASLTILFSNLTMYTILLSLPIFLTERATWRSSQVGLLLAGLSLQMIIFSPIGGWLTDRYSPRLPALSGAILIVSGITPFVFLNDGWVWPLYLAPLVFVGIGTGLLMAPLQTVVMEAAPRGGAGQAAGLFSTMRYLGSILGAATMAAILGGADLEIVDFRALYVVLLVVACGAAVTAAQLPRLGDEPGSLRLGLSRPSVRS